MSDDRRREGQPGRGVWFGSVFVLIVALGSIGLLQPSMREQRQELGIATDSEGTAQLPPDLALINAALGGFRSWAINFMWLRATKLQEEHRVHEAAQLAKWITALSPRFERVWTFQAWNLAFNISRQGQTEADRWRWVVDGLDLLRQRGIEINPLSLHLHAWLSYCFWFKVGGELDEAHRYFKHAHSLEWQQFLGTPPDEAEARLAWFREIALAPSSLTELLEREPRFAPIVDGLDGLGFALDRELLFRLSGAVATAGSDGPSRDGREGALAPIGELLASQDLTDGFLRFLRAKVLREHYHMDPYLMLDLMETLGPFDWRHECSQGAYWIAQGVLRRANQQREVRLTAGHDDLVRVMDRSETLICLRRIALESGRIHWDPAAQRFTRLPDPRFLRAYETSRFTNAPDQVEELFLADLEAATAAAYFFGEPGLVDRYLARLREEIGSEVSIEAFIDAHLRQQVERDVEEGFERFVALQRLYLNVFTRGLAIDRPEVAARFRDAVRRIHATDPEMAILPSWEELERETLVDYLAATAVTATVAEKSRVWMTIPAAERRELANRPITGGTLGDYLRALSRAAGENAEDLFPVGP